MCGVMTVVTLISLIILVVLMGHLEADIDLESTCGAQLQARCPNLASKILGGSPGCAELAPWHAIIDYKHQRKKRKPEEDRIGSQCGGSLVSSRHIITAAHCLWANRHLRARCRKQYIEMGPLECSRYPNCTRGCLRIAAHDILIYLGVTDRSMQPPPTPHRVQKVTIHPGWDKTSIDNNITEGHDIAVLELKEPVNFNAKVWAICLPKSEDRFLVEEKKEVQVNGFGLYSEALEQPDIIQTATLSVVPYEECREYWRLSGNVICAIGTKFVGDRYIDSCNGDSGGGMAAQRFDKRFVLMGVVSFGEAVCGEKGRPGAYTSILDHLEWVRQTMDTPTTCTEAGRACQFPFRYKGNIFTSCTTLNQPQGKPWCATEVRADGNLPSNAKESLGYCTPCRNHSDGGHSSPEEGIDISHEGSEEDGQWSSWVSWGAGTGTWSSWSPATNQDSSEDGEWGSWSSWSSCSATCNAGKMMRRRVCSGSCSSGGSEDAYPCFLEPCPGAGGLSSFGHQWSTWNHSISYTRWSSVSGTQRPVSADWGEWGPCSVTCGRGSRSRRRGCQPSENESSFDLSSRTGEIKAVDCPWSEVNDENCPEKPIPC